ncbi:MAG: hypothetical protein IJM74_08660 [Bacteroidales bacterium]|nr:hypothetical protein [Bacteroidales bacterium]MBQ7711961.1 hypothetical protein [Bacteroidales bacterium]
MDNKKAESRSGEIYEILGQPPKGVVRWGITLIVVVIFALVGGCWFIHYPETITASIIIRKTDVGRTGELILLPAGVGKIKRAQTVIVKLENYPYLEYGYLSAAIDNTSLILEKTVERMPTYHLTLTFPDTISTNTGYLIDDDNDWVGTAEIIIRNSRLIYRFIEPMKAIFQ